MTILLTFCLDGYLIILLTVIIYYKFIYIFLLISLLHILF